jgi:hypothetical protein
MSKRSLLAVVAISLCLLPLKMLLASDDSDADEINSYHLTMDAARRVDAANRAMLQAFAEAGEDDPELFDDESSLDDLEASLQANPIAVVALRSAGIGARDYMRFLMCWAQTAMYAGLVKDGMMPELPPDVRPENVMFLEGHAAELKAMRDRWKD